MVTQRRLRLRERVELVRVVREGGVAEDVFVRGLGVAAVVEVELAELDVCPGGRLGRVGGRVDRELHRLDRGRRVADQLAAVGDTRVRGQARAQLVHPVEVL